MGRSASAAPLFLRRHMPPLWLQQLVELLEHVRRDVCNLACVVSHKKISKAIRELLRQALECRQEGVLFNLPRAERRCLHKAVLEAADRVGWLEPRLHPLLASREAVAASILHGSPIDTPSRTELAACFLNACCDLARALPLEGGVPVRTFARPAAAFLLGSGRLALEGWADALRAGLRGSVDWPVPAAEVQEVQKAHPGALLYAHLASVQYLLELTREGGPACQAVKEALPPAKLLPWLEAAGALLARLLEKGPTGRPAFVELQRQYVSVVLAACTIPEYCQALMPSSPAGSGSTGGGGIGSRRGSGSGGGSGGGKGFAGHGLMVKLLLNSLQTGGAVVESGEGGELVTEADGLKLTARAAHALRLLGTQQGWRARQLGDGAGAPRLPRVLADVASSLAAYVHRQPYGGAAALTEQLCLWACEHVARLVGSLYYEADAQLLLTGGSLTASDWALIREAPQLCNLLSRQVAAGSASSSASSDTDSASSSEQQEASGESSGHVSASAAALAYLLCHLHRVLAFAEMNSSGDSYALWQLDAWGCLCEAGLAHMGLLSQVQAGDPQVESSAGVALLCAGSFSRCATIAATGDLVGLVLQPVDAAERCSGSGGGGDGSGSEGCASSSAGVGQAAAAAVSAAGAEGSGGGGSIDLTPLVGRLCVRLCRAAHLQANGPAEGEEDQRWAHMALRAEGDLLVPPLCSLSTLHVMLLGKGRGRHCQARRTAAALLYWDALQAALGPQGQLSVFGAERERPGVAKQPG